MRAGFFEVAAFQGGTSLRILHQLPRFSEDLDFILKEPDPGFDWGGYLELLTVGLREFGLQSEVLDRSSHPQGATER
jgi:predicted nucleotidyltransferase component of viral defense system